ncbi:MAG: Phytochrome-like protein cph2, partial [Pseudomonadota bacterium]
IAANGGRALELADRTEYAVVLTETTLSDMTGAALIESLSKTASASQYIALTTQRELLPPPRGEQRCSRLVSLITKPWDVDLLSQTLNVANDLYRKRRDQADNLAGNSLLVVDSSADDFALVQDCLDGVPRLKVQRVSRVSDALRVLLDQPVDLILTELCLPDACGVDSVLRLRALAKSAAIVVCTSAEGEQLAEQLMQLGAQDFLTKHNLTEPTLLRALRFARERKRAEERLVQMAFHDPLTGLANRVKFEESAVQALARARRRNTRLACMFVDLDGFKSINDRLGHRAGDALLRDVAARMRQVFREYDVVARLGGDEFAILLTDIDKYNDVNQIAERLCEALSEPTEFDEHELYVTASIGISLYPDVAESVSDLIRCADEAMYDSKRAGKNRFSFAPGRAEATA